MNNIEKEIIETIYKSPYVIDHILNSDKINNINLLYTLMQSEISIDDKINFCYKLLNVRGYKTRVSKIISEYNKFIKKLNSYDVYIVADSDYDDDECYYNIFTSYDNAINYIQNDKEHLFSPDYYKIRLTHMNKINKYEYEIYIKYIKTMDEPLIYNINECVYNNSYDYVKDKSIITNYDIQYGSIIFPYEPYEIYQFTLPNSLMCYVLFNYFGNAYTILENSDTVEYQSYSNDFYEYDYNYHSCKFNALHESDKGFVKNDLYNTLVKLRDSNILNADYFYHHNFLISNIDSYINERYEEYMIKILTSCKDTCDKVFNKIKSIYECYQLNNSIYIKNMRSEINLNRLKNIVCEYDGIDKIEIDYSKDKK